MILFRPFPGRRVSKCWQYPVARGVAKPAYIRVLEVADRGDLRAFVDRIALLASDQIQGSIDIAHQALSGELNRPTGNGGRRVGDDYLPPCNGEPDLDELAS